MELLTELQIGQYSAAIAGICITCVGIKVAAAALVLNRPIKPHQALHALKTYWRLPVYGILAILWISGISFTLRTSVAIYELGDSEFRWSIALFLNVGFALALLVSAFIFTGTGIRDFENELRQRDLSGQARLFPYLPRFIDRFYLKLFSPND